MAAAAAVFDLLPVGADVALPDDCYQAVVGLAAAGQEGGRWSFARVAPDDTDSWLEAAERVDLLWLESPSNPLLHVADLPTILAQPRKEGAIAVIDNTFATPLAQQPLELGADLVLHSATKYLGGHSDLMLGAAVARDGGLGARLRERRQLAGAIPGALETYLAVRGMRTLHLRVERATANAHELATRLERHTDVSVVRYPGLSTHPTHSAARRFMRGYGAMISFDVNGDSARADAICASLQIIRHTTSLGSVESTIERRAGVPGQQHLSPTLLRLSVGCENIEDLWSDLDNALDRTRPTEGR
jgi:cystathionine gamma-synthase